MIGSAGRSDAAAGVVIEPAVAADAAGMRALARAAYAPFVERIGREPAPMTADYAALASAGDGGTRVVRDGGAGMPIEPTVPTELAPVLARLVVELDPDALLIENVAVAPTARGRGLGTLLLDHAETLAREHGLARIRLYTNALMTENLAWYPRRGYVETHRAHDEGFDRVFFEKRLGRVAP